MLPSKVKNRTRICTLTLLSNIILEVVATAIKVFQARNKRLILKEILAALDIHPEPKLQATNSW